MDKLTTQMSFRRPMNFSLIHLMVGIFLISTITIFLFGWPRHASAQTLSFVISAITTGNCNGEPVTVTGTTPTSIPYGVLNANQPKVACLQLDVTTNAANGYVVNLFQDGNMVTGSLADIDQFNSGTRVAGTAPILWASPSTLAGNENTWGHLGVTTSDATLIGGTADRYTTGGPKWSGIPTGSANKEPVASDPGPVTNQLTRVGFKVEISALQEAGSYTNSFQFNLVATF